MIPKLSHRAASWCLLQLCFMTDSQAHVQLLPFCPCVRLAAIMAKQQLQQEHVRWTVCGRRPGI